MLSYYDKEHIEPGIPGVILLSHGPLALALRETASIVFGGVENTAAFCLEPGDDLNAYQAAFMEAYDSYPGCILLVDMKGGTPCNQVLRCARERGTALNAVTGASLPMLLEVLGLRDEADDALLRAAALETGNSDAADLYAFLETH